MTQSIEELTTLKVGAPVCDIRVVEVLEYYDEPVLFFGQSLTGQCYLLMLTVDEPERRQWLLSPMSAARLIAVRNQEVDLRFAFRGAEGGYVWRATTRRGLREVASVEFVRADQLHDDELPSAKEEP